MEPGSSRPGGARGKAPRTTAGTGSGQPNGRPVTPQGGTAKAAPRGGPEGTAPKAGLATIDVVLAEAGWHRLLPRAAVLARRAAHAALAEADAPPGVITVLLADDRALRRLNAEHRGKDKPTNVLSFPAAMPGQLGDIALALGVVRREAQANGRRPAAHFAHLVAHGTLHLLGHDHLEAGEARRMEQAESRVMARLGLPNPWRTGLCPAPPGTRGSAA